MCASLDKDILPYHMHELGKIFSTGSGVSRNYKLALFWEKKAFRCGSRAAQHEVRRLKAILDPEHKRKSTKRRERLQSKIDVALRNFTTDKINGENAYYLIYDNCEFQSKIYGMDGKCSCAFHGEFLIMKIACARGDDGKDVLIPLVVDKKHFSRPWPRVGKCIRGILWMQGFCVV